tara:strand:+ start:78 stop:458 length:381 start_codon:yes stop_codon:yes gene_type:complete
MGNIVKKTFRVLPKEAKPIPGYLTYYATPNGEIWRDAPKMGIRQPRIIKLKDRLNPRTGYYQVQPYVDGKKLVRTVHRLVLSTFEGKCPEGYECDHIDIDRSNNQLSNLRWLTKEENLQRVIKTSY